MISIGVLGVGLGMVMMLFPAAMKEAGRSNENLLGSIICQNGLAMVKTTLRHGGPGTPAGTTLQQISSPLREGDFRYPWNDLNSSHDFAAFGKRVEKHQNDYQFLVLAYGKSEPENEMKMSTVVGLFMPPGLSDPDATKIMFFPTAFCPLPAAGSNLIIPTGDSFESAVIESISGMTAVLDRRLVTLEGASTQMTVLVEWDLTTNEIVPGNPIMYQMLARTALKR